MISPKKNLACKRKSTESPRTPSSTTGQQQQSQPTTKVRISSLASPSDNPHSCEHSADDEFNTRRDNLFKIMPQKPNLPLDRDFVSLARKLSEPAVDPIEFHDHVEEYSSQLAVLEGNGYDVSMLRERFDKLRRISEDIKRSREILEECEKLRKDKQAKVSISLNKIDVMKKQLEALEATATAQKNEIETLELMRMNCVEERNRILHDLSNYISTLVEGGEDESFIALLLWWFGM